MKNKFDGLSGLDYQTEISNLKTKIELSIDRYEVIMNGDAKLGIYTATKTEMTQ